MPHVYKAVQGSSVSEMAIVDTFTKLIFGEEGAYNSRELMIIQALRSVDINVALDNHKDMGEYLRALGVREMIQLVSQVRDRLVDGLPELSVTGQSHSESVAHQAMNRRAH